MPRRYLDQRLKLHVLRIVDALETHRSLLKASAHLGVSQPALTRSLQELEETVGQRLFDRHARGVRPTEAGSVMIRLARRVIAELRRADGDLDRLSSPDGGTVAVGALPVAAVGILPGVLIRLKATYPAIQVQMQEGRMDDLLPRLASGELDLLVGRLYAPPVPDGFVREALWEEPLSVLARAGHPLLGDGPVSAEALRRHDLVVPTVSQRLGQEIDHQLALLGLEGAAPLRSSSHGLIREMLLATDAISVMPRLMMLGDLLRGALRVVPVPVPAAPRSAGLVHRRDPAMPVAAAAFVASLRAYVAEIAARGLAAAPEPESSPARAATGTRRGR